MAQDPARKYATPNPKTRYLLACNFCSKNITSGVRRVKEHLVGGFKNVTACSKCPSHVRDEIIEFMKKKEDAKLDQDLPSASQGRQDFEDLTFGDDEEDDVGNTTIKSKKPRTKSALDVYYDRVPAKGVQVQKLSKGKQQTINDVQRKELRDKACTKLAKWFYEAGIPFNAAKHESFKIAIESVGQYGPGVKPPSYHELRVPLLKKEVESVNALVKEHRDDWATYGCSIISDGWRDSVSHKEIINFLVNSPKGSIFIKSVDVSDIVKDANALVAMFE
ncbi:uncharacterized protein LOC121766940 [Salvia splendens]|uniref:uncharacterized protein LOC121766940 n=1 Tax=Salvia splendens TaxID=180675 RepID=UPI001C26DC9A|nr:uncharacterized protein LOC121766940 [Salvia splendens]